MDSQFYDNELRCTFKYMAYLCLSDAHSKPTRDLGEVGPGVIQLICVNNDIVHLVYAN